MTVTMIAEFLDKKTFDDMLGSATSDRESARIQNFPDNHGIANKTT